MSYTPEALDDELRIAAIAFCEQEANVRVDVESRTLWLSSIFLDYLEDFGTERSVAEAACGWLRGEKKGALEGLLAAGGALGLKRLAYDWGNNASDTLDFVLETRSAAKM